MKRTTTLTEGMEESPKKVKVTTCHTVLNSGDHNQCSQSQFPNFLMKDNAQGSIQLTKVTEPGFDCRHFGFLNGFAVPIQQVPSIQPGVNAFRPQFQYNGHYKFPCPQNQLPVMQYPNNNIGLGQLNYLPGLQPSSSQSSQNDPETINYGLDELSGNPGQSDGPFLNEDFKFHDHPYMFSQSWSENQMKALKFLNKSQEDSVSNENLLCRACELKSSKSDPKPIVECALSPEFKNDKSPSMNRKTEDRRKSPFKCGYGIRDDYVLHGKFVSADSNSEFEDEN